MNKPYILMILDGVGLNDKEEGNAFKQANTPNIDRLVINYPNTYIHTSGRWVGLPDGQMGNSEVGHTNIGAGRVVYQELTRISKEIDDGEFYKNTDILKAIKHVKENNSKLHLCGLLSDGGVHSHIEHLYALLELAKRNNVENVFIHCFMDGRDTSPTSGIKYLQQLQNKINEIGVGNIATVIGRYYAMDRDNRWDRVELAYNAISDGIGINTDNVIEYVSKSYENKETDEFIKPIINSSVNGKVEDNDSIICFNFRPDRVREITRAFVQKDFFDFERKKTIGNLEYVCMTQYDERIENVKVAFKPQILENTFGEYISKKGLKQLRIAETEKYAHVTFFFNGGEEKQYDGEDRILVPSPKVATYDVKPEMSANEITEKVIDQIEENKYDLIIMNYANGDMVGHTGDINAAIKAVETVDKCIGKVYDKVIEKNGVLIITADHGNVEQMVDYATHEEFTQHTTFDVPIIICNAGNITLRAGGALCDIAPTILEIMKIEKPIEMTGNSIIMK